MLLFFAARETRDTPHRTRMHSTAKEREAVMNDDGSQPSIEQLPTAVHHGPATRSWCGPLLLVLLGGVVMLLFSACCLMSSIFGVSYGEHQTSEILIQLLIVEV